MARHFQMLPSLMNKNTSASIRHRLALFEHIDGAITSPAP